MNGNDCCKHAAAEYGPHLVAGLPVERSDDLCSLEVVRNMTNSPPGPSKRKEQVKAPPDELCS